MLIIGYGFTTHSFCLISVLDVNIVAIMIFTALTFMILSIFQLNLGKGLTVHPGRFFTFIAEINLGVIFQYNIV